MQRLDDLDHQLLEMLRINARLPVVKLAKALGVARSTVQLRIKALEDSGHITGYTISVAHPAGGARIRAMVLIALDSRHEHEITKGLTARHEVRQLDAVSGRYDLCAMVATDTTEELEALLDRVRALKGVTETVSTILLSRKLDRPD